MIKKTIQIISGSTGTTIGGVAQNRLWEIIRNPDRDTPLSLGERYYTTTSLMSDGLLLSGTTTGATASTYTYFIGGAKYITQIVGSVTATTFSTNTLESFNIKLGLTSRAKDWGWFDSITGVTTGSTAGATYLVTGTSSSRLSELRKYTVSGTVSQLYFTSTGATTDGVNVALSTGTTFVYYLGGLTYKDEVVGTGTTTIFTYISSGTTDPNNFITGGTFLIKLESKQNVIDNPFINSDVFIVRQEIPVFEQSVRLRGVNSLNDVLIYGGGNYFTIYENT